MASSRGRRPEVVRRCMGCADPLVVIGPSGEPEVPCSRQRCRKQGVTTPIRLHGFIRVPKGMEPDYGLKILAAIQSGSIPPATINQYLDPLYDYRQIEGLILIGPAELGKVCQGPKGENPLGLEDDWIPEIPVPERMAAWVRSQRWRTDKDWATRAALVLAPPNIGNIPTSLIGQNKLWGVSHDGVGAGLVRGDVFWSNWFVQSNYDWAKEPAVADWQWLLVYEHPLWTTKLNSERQKRAAEEKGMSISTAAQDALALNLVLAVTGIQLRLLTWSRTVTLYGGYPLIVDCYALGVRVNQYWPPGHAHADVAGSVQGVPSELG